MSRTIVRRVDASTVIITKPRGPAGPRGADGNDGTVTPELEALLAATEAARDEAEAFSLTPGPQGNPGVNGGVGSSAGYGALKAAADGMTVGAGITRVKMSGYSAAGKGGADYIYDAAVDAAYVTAHPRSAFLAADGRGFRIDLEQPLTPDKLGAAGDAVTNDGPVAVAQLATLEASKTTDGGSEPAKFAAKHYRMGTSTLEINHMLRIQGVSGGQPGSVATQTRWDAGAHGIRFHSGDTSGDRITGASHSSAAASVIEGMFIKGGYAGVAGNYHAIDTNVRIAVRDTTVFNWQGYGINIVASAGGGDGIEGNANCFSISNSSFYGCLSGVHTFGADANTGVLIGVDSSQNREYGFLLEDFLGQTLIGCHTAGNPLGGYKTTNLNGAHVLIGCYAEGDQAPSSFENQTLVIGGQWGSGLTGGVYLFPSTNAELILRCAGGMVVKPETGAASLTLNTPDNNSPLVFQRANVEKARISMSTGDGRLYYNVVPGLFHAFTVDFAETARIDANSLTLAAGKTLGLAGDTIAGFKTMSQAAYDAITPDANTFYFITA